MRHRNKIKKLSRTKEHRKALLNNLVTALFEKNVIITTTEKAKEARKLAEKYITIAKKDNNINARRKISQNIKSRTVVNKLFNEIIPLYKDRNSGYTRVIKVGMRRGDGADVSVLELIEKPVSKENDNK